MKCKTINLARSLQYDSIVDGDGLRTVIWAQGCSHACSGCHNPETWKFNSGMLYSIDDICREIAENKTQIGITFSGGDPMFQAGASAIIAEYARDNGLNVWCYTGFMFEELIEENNYERIEFLKNVDYLIDGLFDISRKTLNLRYRGSTNQRIINVQESLSKKKTIVEKQYDIEKNVGKKEFKTTVFL